MNPPRLNIVLFAIACLLFPEFRARTQQPTDDSKRSPQITSKESSFKPLRQIIAEKNPSLEREWAKVMSLGSPDELLALKQHPDNKLFFPPGGPSGPRYPLSVLAEFGLRPILVAADPNEPPFDVVQGGTVALKLTPDSVFDMPADMPRKEDCKLYDVSVLPKFPITTARQSSVWFKLDEKTVAAMLSVTLTVNIPADAAVGETTLRVTGKTKGPHGGVVREIPLARAFTFRVIPLRGLTREHILCFWFTGIETRDTLRIRTNLTQEERAALEASYQSVSERLTEVAAGKNAALANLAKQLLAHPEFKK